MANQELTEGQKQGSIPLFSPGRANAQNLDCEFHLISI